MKNKKPVWLILGIVTGIALFISLTKESPINIVDKSWIRNGDNVSYSATIRNITEVDEEVTVKVIVETVRDGRGGANPSLVYSYNHKVLVNRKSENKISKTIPVPRSIKGQVIVSFQLVQPVAGGDRPR